MMDELLADLPPLRSGVRGLPELWPTPKLDHYISTDDSWDQPPRRFQGLCLNINTKLDQLGKCRASLAF
uniref:Uncharacterized protein n=1 Tax=Knipowitschia caucasica TaxID=637954 RepID=A0AAV2JXL1_KNICA